MTNREKFIETFGVRPLNTMGCHTFGCANIDCKTCTFNKGAKQGSVWDLEYISHDKNTRNRIVITFKDEKDNIMLFNAKLTIDGNIASVEGNATTNPDAHYMIFHFRMSDVKHIKEVLFDEI